MKQLEYGIDDNSTQKKETIISVSNASCYNEQAALPVNQAYSPSAGNH